MTLSYITREESATRVVIYVRVSTEKQGEQGYSLPEQIKECRRYAELHGYIVVGDPFEDRFTGDSIDRPALDALRLFVKQEKIAVLLVYSIDRLSRDMAYQILIEREFKRYGTRIEYATEAYEDTPHGNFVKNVKSAAAQLEREVIKLRTTRDKLAKARSGGILCNKPPYGYAKEVVGNQTHLIIDEDEARYVRWVFEWYVYDGLTIRGITNRLSEMKVPTRFDKESRKKELNGYGVWAAVTIFEILSDETYAGTWYYNKKQTVPSDTAQRKVKRIARPKSEWIPVAVPALVSRDVFEMTQQRLKTNKERATRNRKHDYLLVGHLSCQCGRSFVGKQQGSGALAYRCTRHNMDASACAIPYFQEAELEPAIWSWLVDAATNIERVTDNLNERRATQERANEPLLLRLQDLDTLIRECDVAYNRIMDRFEKGKIPEDECDERTGRIKVEQASYERERVKLAQQIAHVSYTPAQITDIVTYCQQIAHGMGAFTYDEKRATLELLDVHARLTVEGDEKIAYVTAVITVGAGRLPVGHCVRTITTARCGPGPSGSAK